MTDLASDFVDAFDCTGGSCGRANLPILKQCPDCRVCRDCCECGSGMEG